MGCARTTSSQHLEHSGKSWGVGTPESIRSSGDLCAWDATAWTGERGHVVTDGESLDEAMRAPHDDPREALGCMAEVASTGESAEAAAHCETSEVQLAVDCAVEIAVPALAAVVGSDGGDGGVGQFDEGQGELGGASEACPRMDDNCTSATAAIGALTAPTACLAEVAVACDPPDKVVSCEMDFGVARGDAAIDCSICQENDVAPIGEPLHAARAFAFSTAFPGPSCSRPCDGRENCGCRSELLVESSAVPAELALDVRQSQREHRSLATTFRHVQLMEELDLAYVHTPREQLPPHLMRGGSKARAVGGYSHPLVASARRARRQEGRAEQLALWQLRDALSPPLHPRSPPRVGFALEGQLVLPVPTRSCLRDSGSWVAGSSVAPPLVTSCLEAPETSQDSVGHPLALPVPPSAETARSALHAPRVSSARRFLILFAGRQRPHSLLRRLASKGHAVETFEILDDSEGEDLSKPSLQSELLRRVAAGQFHGVFLAPPCASFCIALQPVLRSLERPEGIEPMPSRWKGYVDRANHLVRFSALMCRAAHSVGAVWMVENPASRKGGLAWWPEHQERASMWDMRCMVDLRRETSAVRITMAQCAMGSDYQKWTTFMASASCESALRSELGQAVCDCKARGVRHRRVAKGQDEFGASLSAPAAEYPPRLCEALACVLDQATLSHAVPEALPPPAAPEVARGLHVGSADPHLLCLDDDKVARSRRAPTFSVRAHIPARHEELALRPVAAMNVAPATDPIPAPAPQGDAPHHVMGMADLLKPVWVKRLSVWRRRLRRCLTLARHGDWRAARRMRPPDLWMDAHECMLPDVAPFDWDLRPWQSGLPAVPTTPSSADGEAPRGSVDLQAVRDSDPAFADQAIVSEILNGVSDDVKGARGSFLCAPHTGALQFYSQARARLDAGVAAGWAFECDSPAFWPMRADPYSIVDESARAGKPKFRLTNDHSWPPPRAVAADGTLVGELGQHVVSINDAMDRGDWPQARLIRVQEVAEAAAVLQSSGVPVRVAAIDVVAYYKQFGRQLSEVHRNGAATESGFIFDEVCCFGSAADATKCCRISNFLVHHARQALQAVDAAFPPRDRAVRDWLAARRAAGEAAGFSDKEVTERFACLHALGMYIDDAAQVSLDDLLYDAAGAPHVVDGVHVRRADAHFQALTRSIQGFGLEITKAQAPATSVDLLGVHIDLDARRMMLTDKKREVYSALALEASQRRSIDKDSFLSLLGKLTFAACTCPRGRQWLHAPWRAARASFRTKADVVMLAGRARLALRAWADALRASDYDGVPIASRCSLPPASSSEAVAIYADAARDCEHAGFGAWVVKGDELLYTHGQWSAEESSGLLICDLELAASTFGLVALQPEVGADCVYSFTDNVVAQAAMRGLTPETPAMQSLCADRVEWMLQSSILETSERITSKANLWADLASRGGADELCRQAIALGLRPRHVPVPPLWRARVLALARDVLHARAEGLPLP